MRIREFQNTDWDEWRRMDLALFPDNEFEDVDADMRALLARSDAAVFLAERPDRSVCGYVEVGSRAYADGCRSSPVGYIEAWYVDPDMRRRGYGRGLLVAAEAWARGRGYTEMASDSRLDNSVSLEAHERSGYQVVDRVVQFRKSIPLNYAEHQRLDAESGRALMPPTLTNGKVCYIEIPAIDIQRSADFYAKVFGWRIKRRGDGSTAFDDTTGQVSGTWVTGWPASAEPGLLIYIMVDSIAATVDAIIREGGQLAPSIEEVDAAHFIARFYDPAGNIFGLYQEPSV